MRKGRKFTGLLLAAAMLAGLRQYKDGYRAGSRSTAASGDIRGSGE